MIGFRQFLLGLLEQHLEKVRTPHSYLKVVSRTLAACVPQEQSDESH